jgi:hypothetical protein
MGSRGCPQSLKHHNQLKITHVFDDQSADFREIRDESVEIPTRRLFHATMVLLQQTANDATY